jgi:hypothetical protein
MMESVRRDALRASLGDFRASRASLGDVRAAVEHDAARMESILAASLASAASTAPAGGKSRALQRAALESLGVTTNRGGNNDSVDMRRSRLSEASIVERQTAIKSHSEAGSETAACNLLAAIHLSCSVSRTQEVEAGGSLALGDDRMCSRSEDLDASVLRWSQGSRGTGCSLAMGDDKMWREASEEHESAHAHEMAILALEDEIKKMGENIEGGLEETQETVAALMQRLTSCEARAKQQLEGAERDKARIPKKYQLY